MSAAKAGREQAGIGEPPPSLDARRSFRLTGSPARFRIVLELFTAVIFSRHLGERLYATFVSFLR
jgi:hypothetical protein